MTLLKRLQSEMDQNAGKTAAAIRMHPATMTDYIYECGPSATTSLVRMADTPPGARMSYNGIPLVVDLGIEGGSFAFDWSA